MFKAIRLPIIVGTVLLFAAEPALHAASINSVLKELYSKSEDGDAGDLFGLIKKTFGDNYQSNLDFIDKLFSKLEDNIDKLAFDVSKSDLKRIKKKLRKSAQQRQAAQFANSGSGGTIAPPTTTVVGG
jgi:phage-related tail protein